MGVCSALFELGGMCVMDDASGCNSTYNTHDEPRWYDTDSLVFITALTESEALMGEDEKTVGDIVSAANELHPRFIALAGTPIPTMCGTDIPALGRVIEKRTGIPSFGLPTDGMHSYLRGCSAAFAALAERIVEDTDIRRENAVNILGLTPLDFSVGGMAESIVKAVGDAGFDVVSSWAMGSSLEDIARSGEAAVNLVVSETGLEAAMILKRRFGAPYVTGAPFGVMLTREIAAALKKGETADPLCPSKDGDIAIVGEYVTSASLAAALRLEAGLTARVICPLESKLSGRGGERIMEENEVRSALEGAKTVICDPLWEPLIPDGARLTALPHEAFSGRIFRSRIPDLTKNEKLSDIISEATK